MQGEGVLCDQEGERDPPYTRGKDPEEREEKKWKKAFLEITALVEEGRRSHCVKKGRGKLHQKPPKPKTLEKKRYQVFPIKKISLISTGGENPKRENQEDGSRTSQIKLFQEERPSTD